MSSLENDRDFDAGLPSRAEVSSARGKCAFLARPVITPARRQDRINSTGPEVVCE